MIVCLLFFKQFSWGVSRRISTKTKARTVAVFCFFEEINDFVMFGGIFMAITVIGCGKFSKPRSKHRGECS